MKNVVIINGPAGVGKTTVGRLLASLSKNGVCIEGDALKKFIVTKQEGAVAGRLGYKNGASLVRNFLEAGYELVVFEYVFQSKEQIDYFLSLLVSASDTRVHVITLWAPLEIVIAREKNRQCRERLGGRVALCYDELKANLASLGRIVMTDKSQPEEIAADIFVSFDQ